jgi:hypothetical protein
MWSELVKPLAELARLWERGSLLLWAFAIGLFACFAVLAALALTGLPRFIDANDTASPWLLLASIMFAVFAALKQYQERTIQTVRLVPIETQCFYHRAVQTDGTVKTQIGVRMDVFNISDKSIWLTDPKLLRPRSHAPTIRSTMLRHQSSDYHGHYELPPKAKTNGSAHLMIQGDLTDRIARQGITLSIEDQFGHRHKLRLTKLRQS